MAIALTAASVVGAGILRTATPSYTVGAASNLLVASIESSVQPSAVTYGGAAMTLASQQDTTDGTWITLAYLLSPATGANNFAFTIGSGPVTILAADYSGVGTTDGAAATNFGSGSASLTTNVTLAGSNEWVVAAGLSGHSGGAFSNTANLTVEAVNSAPTVGLMDTAGGVGPGTIGFVTTVTLTSPRQAVAMQAFTAAGGGTSVAADAGTVLAWTTGTAADATTPVEMLAGAARDATVPAEALADVRRGFAYGGLGGIYGPAVAYWGLRALDGAAAAGVKAIQLQRASDNATMDIHLLASGALDVASAAAFLAGTTGGVSIWYDQSGNGYDMVQATQSLQPQFQFNATPDGQPAVSFTGASSQVLHYDAGIPDQVAPLLCAAYVNPTAIAASPDSVYVDSANGGNQGFQNEGGTDSWVVSFYSLNYVTGGVGWHSVQAALAVGSNASDLHLDGVQNLETYSFTGSNVLLGGPDAIGADTSGVGSFHAYFTGEIAEIGWFATAATNAQLDAGWADQEAAWVTGAAAPGGVQVETGTGQRGDTPAAAEWLGSGAAVAGDSLLPLGFARRLTEDGGVLIESLAARRGDAAATAEFAATRRGDAALPAAWLRWQTADPPAAAESLARSARVIAATFENLGAVAVVEDAFAPLETLRRQQAEAPAPGESLGPRRSDAGMPAETLGTARLGGSVVAEWLARTLCDTGAALEWQGAALATADAPLRLEWLAGQRADPGLPLEFAGGVAVAVLADSGLRIEWGGIVRAEVWAAAELTGGLVAEAKFPAELLVTARARDAGLPLAALLRVRGDPPLAGEWLGRAATIADALVPVEIVGRLIGRAPSPDETLAAAHAREEALPLGPELGVGRYGGGVNAETTVLLLRAGELPTETGGRIGAVAPTAAESTSAMACLVAALPGEWRSAALPLVSLGRLLASIGKRRILEE